MCHLVIYKLGTDNFPPRGWERGLGEGISQNEHGKRTENQTGIQIQYTQGQRSEREVRGKSLGNVTTKETELVGGPKSVLNGVSSGGTSAKNLRIRLDWEVDNNIVEQNKRRVL